MLKTIINKFVVIKNDDELKGLLIATSYGFFIMFSYYILRAVRDEISSADRGNLQLLWTAVFFVMLIAVPAYAWLASKFSRGVFVPLANRFFIACLLTFWLCLVFLPLEARPWIDRVFYVWTSVFALFVVTVFWGFMSDCFDNNQGKRLFSFIAVGSSLGGMAGSATTAGLAENLPAFTLLLLACVPLEFASWCARGLHRRFNTGSVATPGEADKVISGNAWSGMKAVFASRYLMGIAAFIALMTFVSTILYFQQASLVADAFANRGERTVFYAKVDLVVNTLTIIFPGLPDRPYHQMVGSWSDAGHCAGGDGDGVSDPWFVPDPDCAGGGAGDLQSRTLWINQACAGNFMDRAGSRGEV